MKKLLQIVPRFPGSLDGVGDYAQIVANEFQRAGLFQSTFAAPRGIPPSPQTIELSSAVQHHFDAILLHYVNYGFDDKGLPLWLPPLLDRISKHSGVRPVIVFHETFATTRPWKRDFWTLRRQKVILRDLIAIGKTFVVSNEIAAVQLQTISPSLSPMICPTPSCVGEPALSADQISGRDPHRWIIFGGTALVARSIATFLRWYGHASDEEQPHELLVAGGERNPKVEQQLATVPNLRSQVYPQASATVVSDLLQTASYGWLDYFIGAAPAAGVLKSGSFASLCAHAVVPILLSGTLPVQLDGEDLPVEFTSRPDFSRRNAKAKQLHRWYHERASSHHLARHLGEALSQ